MPTVTRTFEVETAPAAVIDYLKDFANAEEWDPGTESCRPLGEGPVQIGSRWHNKSTVAGVSTELVYELTELTDERVVFVGTNDTATSTDTITVTPAGTGSQITYQAEIVFNGVAKVADPLAKVVFEKVGKDTEENLQKILGGRNS